MVSTGSAPGASRSAASSGSRAAAARVVAEAVRVGPGPAVGFRILEVSTEVFLKMSAYR
jgi:hypothetical protein